MENLSTPKDWLGPATQTQTGGTDGLGFITGSVVPFIINLLFFLIITCSLIMLIVGGIMWITSRGEKEGMTKAKGTVTYALIGLLLGLSSFIIVNTLGYILGLDF